MPSIQILYRKKVRANKKYEDLEEEWNRLQRLRTALAHARTIETSVAISHQQNEKIRDLDAQLSDLDLQMQDIEKEISKLNGEIEKLKTKQNNPTITQELDKPNLQARQDTAKAIQADLSETKDLLSKETLVNEDSFVRKTQPERDEQRLYRLLILHFTLEEIKTLVFHLDGVDYEDLSGDTKKSKARELVQLMARHNRLADLQEEIERQRSHISNIKESTTQPIETEINSIDNAAELDEQLTQPERISFFDCYSLSAIFGFSVILAVIGFAGDIKGLYDQFSFCSIHKFIATTILLIGIVLLGGSYLPRFKQQYEENKCNGDRQLLTILVLAASIIFFGLAYKTCYAIAPDIDVTVTPTTEITSHIIPVPSSTSTNGEPTQITPTATGTPNLPPLSVTPTVSVTSSATSATTIATSINTATPTQTATSTPINPNPQPHLCITTTPYIPAVTPPPSTTPTNTPTRLPNPNCTPIPTRTPTLTPTHTPPPATETNSPPPVATPTWTPPPG